MKHDMDMLTTFTRMWLRRMQRRPPVTETSHPVQAAGGTSQCIDPGLDVGERGEEHLDSGDQGVLPRVSPEHTDCSMTSLP